MDSRHGAQRARRSPAARPAAIALIDGEHYPPVVVDTLRELAERYDLVAALFLGGGEKLRERQAVELDELYGLPVTAPAAVPRRRRRAAARRRARPATVRRRRPGRACWRAPARASSLTCPTSRC